MDIRTIALTCIALCFGVACDLSTDAETGGGGCVPNETQSCLCSGGQTGVQSCSEDGNRWLDCICVGSGGDTDSDADGDSDGDSDSEPGPEVNCPVSGVFAVAELEEQLGETSPKTSLTLLFWPAGAIKSLNGLDCTVLDEEPLDWDCADVYQCEDCAFDFGYRVFEDATYYPLAIRDKDRYETACADYSGYYMMGEPCTPSCAGKECGDDGCGGSCGTCADGLSCSGGQCVEAGAGDCGSVPEGTWNCDGRELYYCSGGSLQLKKDCVVCPYIAPSGNEYKTRCHDEIDTPVGWPGDEVYMGPGCYYGYSAICWF